MNGFLFDENLPQRVQFSPALPVISISEVGHSPTDSEVWEFAKRRGLVIVSKVADFFGRIIVHRPPPWVAHEGIGQIIYPA